MHELKNYKLFLALAQSLVPKDKHFKNKSILFSLRLHFYVLTDRMK